MSLGALARRWAINEDICVYVHEHQYECGRFEIHFDIQMAPRIRTCVCVCMFVGHAEQYVHCVFNVASFPLFHEAA